VVYTLGYIVSFKPEDNASYLVEKASFPLESKNF
jgi:hypothetical protein